MPRPRLDCARYFSANRDWLTTGRPEREGARGARSANSVALRGSADRSRMAHPARAKGEMVNRSISGKRRLRRTPRRRAFAALARAIVDLDCPFEARADRDRKRIDRRAQPPSRASALRPTKLEIDRRTIADRAHEMKRR